MSDDIPTSKPLTGLPSNQLISSAEDSPAKTSPLPESKQASTENAAASGLNTLDAFAHYDHATSSWKTYQVCLLTQQWDEFSETWPTSGMTRNGKSFLLPTLVPHTSGKGSGLWLTPSVEDAGRQGKAAAWQEYLEEGRTTQARLRNQVMWRTPTVEDAQDRTWARNNRGEPKLSSQAKYGQHSRWPTPTADDASNVNPKANRRPGLVSKVNERQTFQTPTTPRPHDSENTVGKYYSSQNTQDLTAAVAKTGGQLNPMWVEWLMGYPVGWTDLKG